MKILAIETSCDETAVTILECVGKLPKPEFKVLGNSLMSQIHIHKEYGGVYPMLAKREHIKNLPILFDKTMKESRVKMEDVDYIAVTAGPGLEPALWTGIEFAKNLGEKWRKPVLPINHMEGHLFSFLFEHKTKVEFPAIALLVSGGHTELVLVEDFDKFKIIGRTRDDAVGEAFDKTARLLGLPYPGGPKISALAELSRKRNVFDREFPDVVREQATTFLFPRPMINTKDYDFSYSGLKTSVLYTVKKLGKLSEETKEDIARAFEDAAIEPLVEKARRACDEFGAKSIILGGGVSANKHLQNEIRKVAKENNLNLYQPAKELTTDNAVMIGVAAYIRLLTNQIKSSATISADGNLKLGE